MIVEILKILFGGLCVGLASSVTVGPVAVLCIQRTLSKGYLSGVVSGLGVAIADTLMAILSFTVYALIKSYIDDYSSIIQLCGGICVIIVGIFIIFKNPVPQIRKNRAGKSALWQDFASMFGFTLANFIIVIPYILAFFTMFNIELSNDADVAERPRVEVVAEEDVEASTGSDAQVSYGHMATDYHGIAEAYKERREAEDAKAEKISSNEPVSSPVEISSMFRNTLVIAGFLGGAVLWWVALTSLINLFRRGFRPRHIVVINRVAGIIISALGLYALITVIINF